MLAVGDFGAVFVAGAPTPAQAAVVTVMTAKRKNGKSAGLMRVMFRISSLRHKRHERRLAGQAPELQRVLQAEQDFPSFVAAGGVHAREGRAPRMQAEAGAERLL